ncbi:MAG: carboxypeptidase-like regulatory domain-containing protein, partial [Runella sp.]
MKGRVIDQETKKPVAYVLVYLANSPTKNTYTDSLGTFYLDIGTSSNKNDSIVFTCVGYIKKAISKERLLTQSVVELNPLIYTLQEVVIRAKEQRLTYIGSPKKRIIFFSNCNSTRLGLVFLNHLRIDESYNSMVISKIEIFLSEKGDGPLRLRIMSKDEKKFKPKDNLLHQSVIFVPYRRGWNSFELASPIEIKEKEIFMGVEMLGNSSTEVKQCLGYVSSNHQRSIWGYEPFNSWTPMTFKNKSEIMLFRAGVR